MIFPKSSKLSQLNDSLKVKNPFRRLFWTADLCAAARILLAITAVIYFGNLYHALVAFIVCSLVTDTVFLRPRFKKTFTTKSMREEHITWLKEKQDISPEDLKVFFRKILSYRAFSCSLALISIPAIWFMADKTWALRAAPFVYVVAMFFMFSNLQVEGVGIPKKYRPTKHSESIKFVESPQEYNRSITAIRHWDVTDTRGIAYRSYHAHHEYLRQTARDHLTYTPHKWY